MAQHTEVTLKEALGFWHSFGVAVGLVVADHNGFFGLHLWRPRPGIHH